MKVLNIIFWSLLAGHGMAGELVLPSIFSSHMVLQREQSVPVWGTATSGTRIEVSFADQRQDTIAGEDGHWRVDLAAMPASAEPRIFTVNAGKDVLTFEDVLVGEVWFCSGQSNMEMPLKQTLNSEQVVAEAKHPLIRLYKTPKTPKRAPTDDIGGTWVGCTPETAADFSATAYYFAKKLQQELGVPVGLWLACWGGTPIQPWVPLGGYENGAASLERYNKTAQNMPLENEGTRKYRSTPTALYNGMMHGNLPFAIRGIIWYQGEANRRDGMLYRDLTEAKLSEWRKLWGYEMPYYFVQIPPYNWHGIERGKQEDPHCYPLLWEAQSAITKTVPNTGMVVISDAADVTNLHPANKEAPGTRLAVRALDRTYGFDLVSSGPRFEGARKEGRSMRISFAHSGGLSSRDGKTPDWFELAGVDGVYHAGTARIEGEEVVVESAAVPEPDAVRFAWHITAEPNLMNGAGLPASSFRTSHPESSPEVSAKPAAAHAVSPKERQFKNADTDQNGLMTKQEFVAMRSRYKKPPTTEMNDLSFNSYDRDQNGELSLSEFAK